MPYRRRNRRKYKRRGVKSRASRKRALVSKKRRQRRYAINRLKGRTMSFNRIFKLPGTSNNQTIQYCVIQESEFNFYKDPNVFQHQDRLSNLLQFTSDNQNSRNLQQCFENFGTPPVMQDFVTFRKLFAWTRFKWIRITLVPENYQAVSTGEATIGDTPTHPTLHVINDNGEASQTLGQANSYSVDDARSLAKHQYSEHYFNKPYRFYINLVQRNNTPDPKTPIYSSATRWCPIDASNDALSGTSYIPNDNFYFGFSGVPAGFKYQVKIEACVIGKQLRIADNTA